MHKHFEFLHMHGACGDAVEFATRFPTLRAAWLACERSDWMMWLLRHAGYSDRRKLVKIAVRSIKETPLKNGGFVHDLLKDQRSIDAIAVLQRYVDGGDVTTPELVEAKNAAYAAYAAAYANEQLAKGSEAVEPWIAIKGMKCAFWDDDNAAYCYFDVFKDVEEMYCLDSTSSHWMHCAQLDTIDEIGLPPSYFIERDHRHI